MVQQMVSMAIDETHRDRISEVSCPAFLTMLNVLLQACTSSSLGLKINRHGLSAPLLSLLGKMNQCCSSEGEQRSDSLKLFVCV